MRIAPKPQPGQEISLENLLDSAKAIPRAPETRAEAISNGSDYWTLHQVQTIAGCFDIELQKRVARHVLEEFLDNGVSFEKLKTLRPPCAFEFYAMARHIVEAKNNDRTDEKEKALLEEAFEFVKGFWRQGLILFTTIDYREDKDCIVHLGKTKKEFCFEEDIKYCPTFGNISRELIAQNVLGEKNFAEVWKLWKEYHPGVKPLMQRVNFDDTKLRTYGVMVNEGTIDLRYPFEGRASNQTFLIRRVEA